MTTPEPPRNAQYVLGKRVLPRLPFTPSALRSAGLPALAALAILLGLIGLALWAAWRLLEPIP